MIRRIKRIKNLGLVFKDYTWDNNTPNFERYNLIYGWNGCGKTTLSDLFLALEKGIYSKHPNLSYEIHSDNRNYTNKEPFNLKIRVFNQEYISDNVFRIDGRANPIYILGKENIKLATEIEEHEKVLKDKQSQLQSSENEKQHLENTKAKKFTDIARIISANTAGNGEATRKYDKRNAEGAFQALEQKTILQEKEIQIHNLTLRQLIKSNINDVKLQKIKDIFDELQSEIESLDLLNKLVEQGKNIAITTVESIVIDELKVNADVSEWVETGLNLHNKYLSKHCKFCDQEIPEERIKILCQHFNEADKKIKADVDNIINGLRVIYDNIIKIPLTDKAYLYEELQETYQLVLNSYLTTKSIILNDINNFANSLKEKKLNTTEPLHINNEASLVNLLPLLEEINRFIKKHNQKTENFESEKRSAQKALEKYYLSTIFDEIMQLNEKIKQISDKICDLQYGHPNTTDALGIGQLTQIIKENRSNLSSSEKACFEINEGIKTFLGRSELVFEDAGSGYIIKRNGEIAKNISEGEKTAIAFVYFVFHLKDQDFDITKNIVVIDDPVSSLDSNSKFQAFAFLKNAVIDAFQVFILTHNFDFLRLLLNWLTHIPNKKKNGSTNYYMIKNHYIDGLIRCASIDKLDKTLEEHESEYHYLFKLLKEFKSDGTIASVYHMPNIVRKVLDTFLMFSVPNNLSLYQKLASIKFDEVKKTALYKYANDQSHITGKGFDPSLVYETHRNIEHLFEMMQAIFPNHYNILVESLSIPNKIELNNGSVQEMLDTIGIPEAIE